MTGNIRIVIADDHPMMRDGVARTLNSEPNIEVVGEGANAQHAMHLAQLLMPDIILLDISMPGSGIEAADMIAKTCPVVKIVMLTVSEREDDVMRSLHVGACGYILKGIGSHELVEIVNGVHRGESYVSPLVAGMVTVGSVSYPSNVLADFVLSDGETFVATEPVMEGEANYGSVIQILMLYKHEPALKSGRARAYERID